MTVEELKQAAKKLGYTIHKQHKYPKLNPCSKCGSKRLIRHTCLDRTQYYACTKCGNKSKHTTHKYQAIAQWNAENNATTRLLEVSKLFLLKR